MPGDQAAFELIRAEERFCASPSIFTFSIAETRASSAHLQSHEA